MTPVVTARESESSAGSYLRFFLTRFFLIDGGIEMASLRRSVAILGLLVICSGMALQQGGPGGPGGSSAPVWDFIYPTNNQV